MVEPSKKFRRIIRMEKFIEELEDMIIRAEKEEKFLSDDDFEKLNTVLKNVKKKRELEDEKN